MLAIKVAMQAIVVARRVFEQKRRGPVLSAVVATLQESGVIGGKARLLAHALVPLVRDRRQMGIGRRSHVLDQGRKRIAEILVLAAAKPVPCHDDMAAKPFRPLVKT